MATEASDAALPHLEGAATENPHGPLRLLFVVPFSPRYDTRHGGKVIPQMVDALAARHDVGIAYIRRPGSPPIDAGLARRCRFVHEHRMRRRWWSSAWQHRFRVLSAPLTGLPSAIAITFSPRFAREVAKLAQDWRPHVVQLEHDVLGYCALRLKDGPRATVLVCHDPGLQAARDLARVTSGRQRLAHRLDARLWLRYWRRTFASVDAIVTFSDRDHGVLDAVRAGSPRIVTIPLGIDIPAAPLSETGSGEDSVLFVGGYTHLPNADAAVRLERSIMPTVRRSVPGARLLLVGADPTKEMTAAAGADDTVTGVVPDVTPYVDQASVVALPIRLGGGMRVKLLEALAAGKAVVASPLAAAGLDVTDGEELVLAESDEEFAEAIAALLRNSRERARLARNGRAWAAQHLSWEARAKAYEDLYRSLLTDARR
jgi:polysaccharide biosynthesis protein PslH